MSPPSSHQAFTLPVGLVDRAGRRHRCGTLRAATARDEIRVLRDFRVHLRPESFLPLMLARTIVRLGDMERVDARQLESLRPPDLGALEQAYRQLNGYLPAARDLPDPLGANAEAS